MLLAVRKTRKVYFNKEGKEVEPSPFKALLYVLTSGKSGERIISSVITEEVKLLTVKSEEDAASEVINLATRFNWDLNSVIVERL